MHINLYAGIHIKILYSGSHWSTRGWSVQKFWAIACSSLCLGQWRLLKEVICTCAGSWSRPCLPYPVWTSRCYQRVWMKQLHGTHHSSARVLPCFAYVVFFLLCQIRCLLMAPGSDPALSHILMRLRNRKLRCEVKNGTELFHQAILPELRNGFK